MSKTTPKKRASLPILYVRFTRDGAYLQASDCRDVAEEYAYLGDRIVEYAPKRRVRRKKMSDK